MIDREAEEGNFGSPCRAMGETCYFDEVLAITSLIWSSVLFLGSMEKSQATFAYVPTYGMILMITAKRK